MSLDSGMRARVILQVRIPVGMAEQEIASWLTNNISPTLFLSAYIEKTDIVVGKLQPGPIVTGG